MKIIPLTKGRVAIVDDADHERLNQWKWRAEQTRHTFYAIRNVRVAKGKRSTERMHRLILGLHPTHKLYTDHIDGDGLNNQRSNLRTCTVMQNGQSRRKHKFGTSRYKGVSWYGRDSKWQSHISINGRFIRLGCFNSETEAARAYDKAALKHFGDFALTNKTLNLEGVNHA